MIRQLPRNVLVLGAVSLLTDLSSEMIYPLLPLFMAGVLGSSVAFIGVVEGAAESISGLLKLASGWWSDRVRRRKPLVVAGYALASAVRPLVSLAQSAGHVLAIRLTDRVGKGLRSAPRDALIADSVSRSIRGYAFGFHRAADHVGAVLGPLVAFVLLRYLGLELRTIFLLAAFPAAAAVAVLVFGFREAGFAPGLAEAAVEEEIRKATPVPDPPPIIVVEPIQPRFWAVLGVVFLFTLGNSTDAFLLLRASDAGLSVAMLPLLWGGLHVVKSVAAIPGGALSDRLGRKPLIIAGWVIYAMVYLGFGRASQEWHIWALFGAYGLFFGMTEGTEKALVADMAPEQRRGFAFGAYNLAISLGALPASLLFGLIWDKAGAARAFEFGATLAMLAAIGLLMIAPDGKSPDNEQFPEEEEEAEAIPPQ